MKIHHSLLMLVGLLATLQVCATISCNASHFDLIGRYTLGKQDELNRTFTKLQEKITTLGNVTFNYSGSTTYTIYNAKPTFYYRDSKQKADIIGKDLIVVSGGILEVDLTFSWGKKDSISPQKNGTALARGLSDMITFVKSISIDTGFFTFDLFEYDNVTWSEGDAINLYRVDPPDTTEEDRAVLLRMLNNIMGVKTLRFELEEEIDKLYSYYLSNSLHDEHMPIDDHFDYTWNPRTPGRQNVTIPFSRRPITIDIEPDGIRLTFDNQVKDDTNWKCGSRNIPDHPRNPNVFGHSQQFISLDFYTSVIRYAIQKNILDTNLNRQNWESNMFQFFAGDLYDIFPLLQTMVYASQPIDGNCKANYQGLTVTKAGDDTFNVSIRYDCELNVKKQKLVDFGVALVLTIAGHPRESTIDFRIRSHQQTVTFYPYGDFQMKNKELAQTMVNRCLNRMYHGNLFGSGWPLSPPRDYPHFIVQQDYTIVYDSTQVNPREE